MVSETSRNRWVVFGLMMGLLLSAMDQTVTATAMPTIISSLGGLSLYSWVFSIYMLTTTIAIPIFGKLADLYGRRIMYLIGMGLFLGGSALCGFAESMLQLIIFRGVQGLGAGALMPLAMTIVGDLFPPEKRGRMQGLIGAVFGISSIAGPTMGGFITEHFDWHWVFFVNLPLGIIAALILAVALKKTQSTTAPRIDWAGAFVLTTATISILLITVLGGDGNGQGTYAWTSPQITGLIILGVVLTGLFIWIESRAKEPIIPLSLFKNRVITICSIVGFLSAVGMFGAVTFIPLFAQGVIGVSPSIAGYIMTPMMLSIVVSSTVSGIFMTRFKYRTWMVFSMSILSLGLFLMSRMTTETTGLQIALYMIITGIGMGPLMPLLTVAVQEAVGFNQRGVATSAVSFFRTIGGALGVSILGAVMTNNMTKGLQNLGSSMPGISGEMMAKFNNAQSLLSPQVKAMMPPQLIEAISTILAQSIVRVFGVAVIFILIGLGAGLWMGNRKLSKSREGMALSQNKN